MWGWNHCCYIHCGCSLQKLETCTWRCVLSSSLYSVISALFGVFLPYPLSGLTEVFWLLHKSWPFFLFCLQCLFPVFFPSPTPFFTPGSISSVVLALSLTIYIFFPIIFLLRIESYNITSSLCCVFVSVVAAECLLSTNLCHS